MFCCISQQTRSKPWWNHLKKIRNIYSACKPFDKNKKKEFKEAGDSRYISHKDLDKACFRHDMA